MREIEEKVLASAAANKGVLKYFSSRLSEEDFEDREAKYNWRLLLADKPIRVNGEPESDPAILAQMVKELKMARAIRQIQELSYSILTALAEGPPQNPEALIKSFLRKAARVVPAMRQREKIYSTQEWLEIGQKEILKRKTEVPILNLGLKQLTERVSAEPGHLVIIAAKWGKGKTALALNIAAALAVKQGIPTLYLNTEMSISELALRLYALLGSLPLTSLRAGRADEKITNVAEEVKAKNLTGKLWLSDHLPWLDLNEVDAMTREYVAVADIRVLILDYIQKLETGGNKDRWQALLDISKHLKNLAQELNILVIVLAQLNGEDLAGARQMAQDADAVFYLDKRDEPGVTHVLESQKVRHVAQAPPIKLRMDPRTLEIMEVEEEDPFN